MALYSLSMDDVPESDVDQPFRQAMLERARVGAERLHVCVTYSQHWKEFGERKHEDVWANRITKFWTPPVCP